MRDRIVEMVSQALGVRPEALRADRELIEYGLDSARAIELIADLEDAFNIEIDDAVAMKLRTVDDIVRHVQAQQAGE